MDAELVKRHNALVSINDIVIHAGDFTLGNKECAFKYQKQLNGTHIFLKGSHDKWLKGYKAHEIWEKTIEDKFMVVGHYAMRVWHRSHYNSWNLYAHSHGKLEPIGKQWDIGVDNNGFYPVSFVEIKALM